MASLTPYDNRIAVWHHKGQPLVDKLPTPTAVAQYLQRYLPAIGQVWVKTSNGAEWMSTYDDAPALAINGPDAVRRWIIALQTCGLEFHAWCVVKGMDIEAEAQRIIEVARVPGVRSMILDVEPHAGFYQGGREAIRPLMLKVRAALGPTFHLGLAVDPRRDLAPRIYPDEWYPFVNSVHLQLFWPSFNQPLAAVIDDGFSTWHSYGRPLAAVLPVNDLAASLNAARQISQQHGATNGWSWYALEQLVLQEDPVRRADQQTALNILPSGESAAVPPDAQGLTRRYGSPIVIGPERAGYTDGTYAENVSFELFKSESGGPAKYIQTQADAADVYAQYNPKLQVSGWYHIEAFIPARHASTGNARYKLHGVRGMPDELTLTVPQALYNDAWVALGTYYIDTSLPKAGYLYLTDWTLETGREIAFDAIRWRPVFEAPVPEVTAYAPFLSALSARARDIVQHGHLLGNRADVFSRVGDSITYAPQFLTPFGEGRYDLGSYRAELNDVVQYFLRTTARTANSFANAPIAAANGWSAELILQPGHAYPTLCGGLSPLECEYQEVRPALALIMIGTNDSGGVSVQDYTANLRRILDISIQYGVLPVLSTIPAKLNDTWNQKRGLQWNAIIRATAQQYDIPLWDYYEAMTALPNRGISADGIHPSEPPDGRTGYFTLDTLRYGYPMRNLTALQALNAIWRSLLQEVSAG